MTVMQKIRRFFFGGEVHDAMRDLGAASTDLHDHTFELRRAVRPIIEADNPFVALAHQVHNAETARMLKE